MQTWIIEPRDPLIVRDGRPFGPTPGARAISLSFPFPSTITGGLRTRVGLNEQGIFDLNETQLKELLQIAVRGPFLVELSQAGTIKEWLFPAPSDALLLDVARKHKKVPCLPIESKRVIRKVLCPLAPPEGTISNLPEGLTFVRMFSYNPSKPYKKAPHFWYWKKLQEWLMTAQDDSKPINPEILGHHGPQPEERMHVQISDETRMAREGYLFQTQGLEFRRNREKTLTLPPRHRLALVVATEASLSPGYAPLGGERRLVNWRQSDEPLPVCPPEIKKQIIHQKSCRLLLATPACFNKGYYPTWLLETSGGAQIKAIAIGRPQIISGWDLVTKRPKPTRRLAPAGSVYFLKLEGNEQDIAQWIDNIWLQSVSDSEQDRRDGFGVALLGTWQDETAPNTEETS